MGSLFVRGVGERLGRVFAYSRRWISVRSVYIFFVCMIDCGFGHMREGI